MTGFIKHGNYRMVGLWSQLHQISFLSDVRQMHMHRPVFVASDCFVKMLTVGLA